MKRKYRLLAGLLAGILAFFPIHGEASSVAQTEGETEKTQIIFLLDASQSMEKEERWIDAADSVCMIAASLPENCEAAALVYNTEIVYQENFGSIDQSTRDILGKIELNGYTSPAIAVEEACSIAGDLTLKNVVIKDKQYETFFKVGGQSYQSKSPDDPGWINAVKLGHYMAEAFGEDSTMELSKENLEEIRNELVENIGESPVGDGVSFRSSDYFYENYSMENGKHYFNGQEIKPNFKNHNGNIYFDYIAS